METTLSKQNGAVNAGLNPSDIIALVQAGIIPQGTPDAQIKIFASVCKEKNLSPFSKQIHLIKRYSKEGDRYTVQTAVDGLRAIAERTGAYAGSTDYSFDEGRTQYEMITSNRKPVTASVTVRKIVQGIICEFTSTAEWAAYYPGEKMGFMWNKMPFLMIGKCAESLALRKAFPENLSGIYSTEEMQQAEIVYDGTGEEKIPAEDYQIAIDKINDFDKLMAFGKTHPLKSSDIFRTAVALRVNEIRKGVKHE